MATWVGSPVMLRQYLAGMCDGARNGPVYEAWCWVICNRGIVVTCCGNRRRKDLYHCDVICHSAAPLWIAVFNLDRCSRYQSGFVYCLVECPLQIYTDTPLKALAILILYCHYYTIIQRMADVAVIDMSFFKVDIMEVNIRKAVKGDCKAIR